MKKEYKIKKQDILSGEEEISGAYTVIKYGRHQYRIKTEDLDKIKKDKK